MSYFGNMVAMYANAWLEVNELKWTEENWTKALNWARSHSAKECREYIVGNLDTGR